MKRLLGLKKKELKRIKVSKAFDKNRQVFVMLCLVLSGVLSTGMTKFKAVAGDDESMFKDIEANAWYKESVDLLVGVSPTF